MPPSFSNRSEELSRIQRPYENDSAEFIQLLDGQMSVDELADELGVDAADVRERLAYLSEFDRVRRDGETIYPPEQ